MTQLLSTALAWGIVVILAVLAWRFLRAQRDVAPVVMAWFVAGAILMAAATALTATGVLIQGPRLPEWAAMAIACSRAAAAAIFLGVTMHVTGKPRWLVRMVHQITGWLVRVV